MYSSVPTIWPSAVNLLRSVSGSSTALAAPAGSGPASLPAASVGITIGLPSLPLITLPAASAATMTKTGSPALVSLAVVAAGSWIVLVASFGSGMVLVVSGTDAVESILKSLMVGGGTLAGSGRGIAASIASSAGVLRDWSWASAEVARNVAATATNTRSNPPRLFEQSRIVTPLG